MPRDKADTCQPCRGAFDWKAAGTVLSGITARTGILSEKRKGKRGKRGRGGKRGKRGKKGNPTIEEAQGEKKSYTEFVQDRERRSGRMVSLREEEEEMGIFYDKLTEIAPVVKRKHRLTGPNIGREQTAVLECFSGEEYEQVPYLKPIRDFYRIIGGEIRGKRIFLVTEEETAAVKGALGMIAYPYCEVWMEEGGCVREYTRSSFSEQLFLVDMTASLPVHQGENPYFHMASGVRENSSVLYWGLAENGSLEYKLDLILGSPAERQFVRLLPEQLDKPWARELMMDKECEVVHIPRTESGYYAAVTERLLDGERYSLAKDFSPMRLVQRIMKKRGDRFGEEDIAWTLDQAVKRIPREEKRYVLTERDCFFAEPERQDSLQVLQEMKGLCNVKKIAVEYAALVQEQERNEKLRDICKNMVFAGNPGTGKTHCARLLAGILAEQSQNNGIFVDAARKDIIGEYVGHTAPKVARLFELSKRGILFVDEAGFFLHDTQRDFVREAVKEFVRYMELCQDVTVIFALYPHEVEEWLALEAGLASRISRVVEFSDYSNQELLEIADSMCLQRGYRMEEGAKRAVEDYLDDRRGILRESFGNAREVRKLVESAVISRGVRLYGRADREEELLLKAEDFAEGAARITPEVRKRPGIGFACGERGMGVV